MNFKLVGIGLIAIVIIGGVTFFFVRFPGKKLARVEITRGEDDGQVYILADFPIPAGYAIYNMSGVYVGATMGGTNKLKSRAVYRFDISDWKSGNITFNFYCFQKVGEPGKIEVYVIDNFGDLAANQVGDPQDLSSIWNLINTGVKVGSLTLEENKYFSVTVSETVLKSRGSPDHLCFMIKIENEDQSAWNAYLLGTYEYYQDHGKGIPYVTWPV
ncbi:MAG: hypothetical protein ACP6IP_05150 [Candidatus Njordarchaeia archaeon]